jgi:hypothetical protein
MNIVCKRALCGLTTKGGGAVYAILEHNQLHVQTPPIATYT